MRNAGVAFLIAGNCLFGQSYQRQATITGGGSFDRGQCIVEVQVDSTAEVQIRGTAGVLTNVAGASPQWRRFECTGAMPVNPTSFQYKATGGRGQQQLVRDPSDSGVAIVRIEDKSGGSAAYAFTLTWEGYAGNPSSGSIFDPSYNPDTAAKGRGKNSMSSAEAVESCQQQIMSQATQRFGTNNIYFRRTALQNNKGGQDQVRGTIDVNANNQSSRYRFNCSVNLNNGRVRSAQIDNAPAGQNVRDYGYNNNVANSNRAIQACESAVDRRFSEQGWQRVGFGTVDIDDRSGSNRVYGVATVTDSSRRQQTVDFSCRVNFSTGNVDGVDAIPRR